MPKACERVGEIFFLKLFYEKTKYGPFAINLDFFQSDL